MSDMAVDFELTYKEQLQEEINSTPGEYLPALLQIVRLLRKQFSDPLIYRQLTTNN